MQHAHQKELPTFVVRRHSERDIAAVHEEQVPENARGGRARVDEGEEEVLPADLVDAGEEDFFGGVGAGGEGEELGVRAEEGAEDVEDGVVVEDAVLREGGLGCSVVVWGGVAWGTCGRTAAYSDAAHRDPSAQSAPPSLPPNPATCGRRAP